MLSEDPIDPVPVLHTLIDVLNSLTVIHTRHCSHVPLTPATIRFNERGQPEIASYHTAGTESTVVFGSPKYAAPDALHRGINQQGCAELDSYILGFIFYELLLGKRLFEGEFKKVNNTSTSSWLTWHANPVEYARPLIEVITNFPPRLSQIVASMMEKDPRKRTTDLVWIAESLQSTIDNTLFITNLSTITRNETLVAEMPLGARPLQRTNRAGQTLPGMLRVVRGKYRVIRRALAGMPIVSHWSLRKAEGRRLTKLSGKKADGSIDSVVSPAPGMAGRSRFYLFFASLILLALSGWLWKSIGQSTGVPVSLPPVILTDTGEMVLVPGDEVGPAAADAQSKELQRQTFSTAFYIDRHEVSMRYYWKFCHATGRTLPPGPIWDAQYAEKPNNPILNVPWSDAYAFAEWAGKWLPSVAEWKAAASTTAGRLLDFHVFETAPPGVRSYSRVDASSMDWFDRSERAIRTDVDPNVLVPVRVSDLNGTEVIAFRCAASIEILQTPHLSGNADLSRLGSLR